MSQMELIDGLRDKCKIKLEETGDSKYELIARILNDANCFFAIDMDVALDILTSLDVNNPVSLYKELISPQEMDKNKIKVID